MLEYCQHSICVYIQESGAKKFLIMGHNHQHCHRSVQDSGFCAELCLNAPFGMSQMQSRCFSLHSNVPCLVVLLCVSAGPLRLSVFFRNGQRAARGSPDVRTFCHYYRVCHTVEPDATSHSNLTLSAMSQVGFTAFFHTFFSHSFFLRAWMPWNLVN